MFNRKTVFILGAGASCHYGYPTGQRLVDIAAERADRIAAHCSNRLQSEKISINQCLPKFIQHRMHGKPETASGYQQAWGEAKSECELLSQRLRTVQPLVVDYFLGWNESLREVGKLAIAIAILECEAKDILNARVNRESWYRFLTHRLIVGCKESPDLLKNNVNFITFNYDTSLEYHLQAALGCIDLIQKGDVDAFLSGDRIIHIYGKVHAGIPRDRDVIGLDAAGQLYQPLGPGNPPSPLTDLLDRCWAAANSIRTIDPHDKEDDGILARARELIADADVVYILGYGFDENNNRRLNLESALSRKSRNGRPVRIMFTNLDDINSVNKRASYVCFGSLARFLDDSLINETTYYVEKSTRTVYDALEKDFDALEIRGRLNG